MDVLVKESQFGKILGRNEKGHVDPGWQTTGIFSWFSSVENQQRQGDGIRSVSLPTPGMTTSELRPVPTALYFQLLCLVCFCSVALLKSKLQVWCGLFHVSPLCCLLKLGNASTVLLPKNVTMCSLSRGLCFKMRLKLSITWGEMV